MTFGQHPAQDLLDELAGELEDDDFAPPPTPASAAAAAAAFRRADAARKRDERAKRRAEGLPDQRVIDACITQGISDALKAVDARGHMLRHGRLTGLDVPVAAVMKAALHHLMDRGCEKAVAVRVLQGRVLPSA
ncbi:hypothetical protein ACYQR9_15465 [Methylobacterium sp. CM6241]